MHVVVLALLCGGAVDARAQVGSDSAAFVTRLGADTLVLERFTLNSRRLEAEVVLRVPRTTRTRYALDLSPSGEWIHMEAVTFDALGRGTAPERETYTRQGDSIVVVTEAGGQERRRSISAPASTLPFIDMVHWPYELALRRLAASEDSRVAQPLLTGSRVAPFAMVLIGRDSATITHPSRGTMRVLVDADGRLLALDAGATTRKLLVERRRWISLDPVAERWAADDAAGRSFGALSGRAETQVVVAGATILVDHGTPSRRGREIWGALVPFGQVWRTGANQATHFTTDQDLILGWEGDTLAVPAGRYTLFSIPEADGGVLIVSRETGQAGTAYDPARDLGRVRLRARPLPQLVEVFTIAVTEEGSGGLVRLQWDRRELVVPFVVR
jgi:hypothetical protein